MVAVTGATSNSMNCVTSLALKGNRACQLVNPNEGVWGSIGPGLVGISTISV